MTRLDLTVLLVAGFACAACGDAPETTIELDVLYDEGWALDALVGTVGDRTITLAARPQIELLVPDAWAGTEIEVEVLGMRGTESVARGFRTVVPVFGTVVRDRLSLSLLSCTNACTEGATMCKEGGVSRCAQRPDTCFDWATPEPCGAPALRCSDGACVADADPVVRPSNAEVIGRLVETGIVRDVPVGTAFSTDSDCRVGSAFGDCEVVARADLPPICVCRVDTLTLRGPVIGGGNALAILAWKRVIVTDDLTVQPGTGQASTTPVTGTAGGSFGTRGGGTSLDPVGEPTLIPLRGGSRGGGPEGLGGGAIQITANEEIVVDGAINAPGGGGRCVNAEESGGGSGGAILLESREVTIGRVLAANGGGGSGGDIRRTGGLATNGSIGFTGLPSTTDAARGGDGGTACSGERYGGVGGSGSIGNGGGGFGDTGRNGTCSLNDQWYDAGHGGGGGGAGRIRVNTTNGSCSSCVGKTSPTATIGTVVLE